MLKDRVKLMWLHPCPTLLNLTFKLCTGISAKNAPTNKPLALWKIGS